MVSGSVGTLKAVTLNRIGLKYRTSRRGSTRESSMTRRLLFVVSAGLVFTALLAGGGPTAAQTSTALTGRVSSAEEGAMEGVVVSAKKAGSTVTVSVVSDAQGRFSFPSAKLVSGHYALRVRATGWELEVPVSVEVTLALPSVADLKLRKARNLAAQMSNAEWMMSLPGTE